MLIITKASWLSHKNLLYLISSVLRCITLTGQHGSATPTQSPAEHDPSVKLSVTKQRQSWSSVCVALRNTALVLLKWNTTSKVMSLVLTLHNLSSNSSSWVKRKAKLYYSNMDRWVLLVHWLPDARRGPRCGSTCPVPSGHCPTGQRSSEA